MDIGKDKRAVDYVKTNYRNLLPFAKELVLLMEELSAEDGIDFSDMEVGLVDLILHPATRHMPVTRAWLLEIFARGIVPISAAQLRRLEALSHILDVRVILRIRANMRELHYFRHMKTRINDFSGWLQPALLFSAACLTVDEYRTWLGSIKNAVHFPMAPLFIDWLRER